MTIFIFSYILVFHSHSFEEQTSAAIHIKKNTGIRKKISLSLMLMTFFNKNIRDSFVYPKNK